MQTRFTYLLKYIVALVDMVLLAFIFIISTELSGVIYGVEINSVYRFYLPIVIATWLICVSAFNVYKHLALGKLEEFYRRSLRSFITHILLFGLALLFIEYRGLSLKFFFHFYPIFGLSMLISRFVGTFLQSMLVSKFQVRKKVAIMGKNSGSEKLEKYFRTHENTYAFEGYLSENDSLFVNSSGRLTQVVLNQFQKALANDIDEIYLSIAPEYMSLTEPLIKQAEKLCIRLKIVPDWNNEDDVPFNISYMDKMPVLSIRREPAYEIGSRVKKRMFDILFSSLVIIFVLSWLYPLLAILIKLESPGPVLFKQQRSGRDNKPFWCYKFRSMRVNKDSDSKQAAKGDSRITDIGKFLRESSLDELPQFLNVLQGHMSVCGPRPHMLKHTEQYSEVIEKYMVRQYLKPGITGWAQVNGYRGETKDPYLMERRVAHDIWYLENWTAMLDVKIVFLTVINMITGEENAV